MTERRSTVVNDIMKILVAHLCLNEHRTSFHVSNRFVEAAPFNDLEIAWSKTLDGYVITLKDRSKKKLGDGIQEVDFEILESKRLK